MLQHESHEQPTTTPAAQIRVTSEELTQAINALQASKDEAARHLAGTVPIGEVVKELNLEATPEEVWTQVQKQRTQQAAEAAAAEAAAAQRTQAAAAQAGIYQTPPQAPLQQIPLQIPLRPRRRRWRWWAIAGVAWAAYGIAHGSFSSSHTAGSALSGVITGDHQTLTSRTQGKAVEVLGDKDTLVLQGNCPTLTITGDGNHIRVEGTVGRIIAMGDNNSVVYTQGEAPALSGFGDGNQVGPSAP